MGSHGIALYAGRITLSLIAVGCAVVGVPSAGGGEYASEIPDASQEGASKFRSVFSS